MLVSSIFSVFFSGEFWMFWSFNRFSSSKFQTKGGTQPSLVSQNLSGMTVACCSQTNPTKPSKTGAERPKTEETGKWGPGFYQRNISTRWQQLEAGGPIMPMKAVYFSHKKGGLGALACHSIFFTILGEKTILFSVLKIWFRYVGVNMTSERGNHRWVARSLRSSSIPSDAVERNPNPLCLVTPNSKNILYVIYETKEFKSKNVFIWDDYDVNNAEREHFSSNLHPKSNGTVLIFFCVKCPDPMRTWWPDSPWMWLNGRWLLQKTSHGSGTMDPSKKNEQFYLVVVEPTPLKKKESTWESSLSRGDNILFFWNHHLLVG